MSDGIAGETSNRELIVIPKRTKIKSAVKRNVWNLLYVLISGSCFTIGKLVEVTMYWQLDLMRDVICMENVTNPSDLWILRFGFPGWSGTVWMPLQRAWDLVMFYGFFGGLLFNVLSFAFFALAIWRWNE